MTNVSEKITAFVSEQGTVESLSALREGLRGISAKRVYKALVELSLSGELSIDKRGIRPSSTQDKGDTGYASHHAIPHTLHQSLGHPHNKPTEPARDSAPVEALNLPEHITRRLLMARISDVTALASMSESDLLSIRGIGLGKVEKIKSALAEFDPEFTLKPDGQGPAPADPIPLQEWVESLPDRKRTAVTGRLAGKTLQAVASEMGITRERVRQLVDAALKRRPPMMEDSRRSMFDAYAFDEKSFCTATGEGPEAFHYLALTSENRPDDRKPLSAIVDDPTADEAIRKAVIDGAVDTEVIFEGNRRIPKDKRSIVKHLLETKHGEEPVLVADLLQEYENFLSERSISPEGRLNPTNLRAFDSCIERYGIALPTQGPDGSASGWVRAFDSEVDLEPLRDALGRETNRNIECSAELLMREGPVAESARRAGIRNGTELHVVIGRYLDGIDGIKLGRSPMLTLGSASRDEQILALIKEMSPVDVRELAAEYDARYGMRADSFAGTCLRGFESYLVDGRYRYMERDLSAPEKNFVTQYLENRAGYAPFEELKAAFFAAFPEEAASLPGESLAKAGFRIADNLVVLAAINLPHAFEVLISEADYFDDEENGFGGDIMRNLEFRSVLNKMLRNYEVVEYEPGFFLNARTLGEAGPGFTSADLGDYTDKVIDFVVPNVPYSLQSLHRAGFSHRIEALRKEVSMGDRFFESVLSQGYVGSRPSRTDIESVIIFCKPSAGPPPVDVVKYAFAKKALSRLAPLGISWKTNTGVNIPKTKLRSIVMRANLCPESDIA